MERIAEDELEGVVRQAGEACPGHTLALLVEGLEHYLTLRQRREFKVHPDAALKQIWVWRLTADPFVCQRIPHEGPAKVWVCARVGGGQERMQGMRARVAFAMGGLYGREERRRLVG